MSEVIFSCILLAHIIILQRLNISFSGNDIVMIYFSERVHFKSNLSRVTLRNDIHHFMIIILMIHH